MSNLKQTVDHWLSDLSRDRQALVVVASTLAAAKKAAIDSTKGSRRAGLKAADLDQDGEPLRKALARSADVLIIAGMPRTSEGSSKAKQLISQQWIVVSDHEPHARAVKTPRLIFCISAHGFVQPDSMDRRFRVLFEGTHP